MKSSFENKIQAVRSILDRRYPDYAHKGIGERTLLAMSVLANDIQVREVGRNGGDWVTAILASCGLGPGNPWCAASIRFSQLVAGVIGGPSSGAASVKMWHDWAEGCGRLRSKPTRGRLCLFLQSDGHGHIGIIAEVNGDQVTSYEGNTSSGESGSQRDGDGLYRRIRPCSHCARIASTGPS